MTHGVEGPFCVNEAFVFRTLLPTLPAWRTRHTNTREDTMLREGAREGER